MNRSLPVAVIGAGPIGLAAAAHLVSRGETPIVFETGKGPGATILRWDHVRMFSSWAINLDPTAVRLLERSGRKMPVLDTFPTGREFVEKYLEPLADLPEIRPRIMYNSTVTSIVRQGFDRARLVGRWGAPFEVRVKLTNESERRYLAKAVIDASGTWYSPNPVGAAGLPAVGEVGASHVTYGVPDVLGEGFDRYAGRRVMVVGTGHSAINVVLDLVRLRAANPDTQVVWAMRSKHVNRSTEGAIDSILPARPDHSITQELQLSLDPWLECPSAVAWLIEEAARNGAGIPRAHGVRELAHPEKDYYVVGMKSHGRARNFFAATGYEQVRSVVAMLAGDQQAAERVEFSFPAGGVCAGCGDGACCAPTIPAPKGSAGFNDG
ncbi:MAG: NAD(P)-binding domain-containing protein [Gammaproteobacteria bacterium]